jgi:hypothetical protein
MLIVLLFLFASACHPECVTVCDSPVKAAVCEHLCKTPVCTTQCDGSEPFECDAPRCEVRCPLGMCESDSCPQCEVICEKPSCFPWGRNCSILCEETQCNWHCRKPDDKPNVTCEWQCEEPACAAQPQDIPTHVPLSTSSSVGLVLALALGPTVALLVFARIRYAQKH